MLTTITFYILILKDVRLPLVVWGKVALDLSEAIQLLSDRTLICVMKFGKIKIWKGKRLYFHEVTYFK